MTTDVSAEIAALKKKIEDAEVEIEQVEAALGLDSTWSGSTNPYADAEKWTLEDLKAELGRLRDNLTAEKNLLLVELRKQGAHSTAPRHALVFQVLRRRKSSC